MKEYRVRQGEWNEALCFSVDKHPYTEVAAQLCRDHWNVFYVSSKSAVTLAWGIKEQEAAEGIAREVAEEILNSLNPIGKAFEIRESKRFQ